jgi:hypothetical protein
VLLGPYLGGNIPVRSGKSLIIDKMYAEYFNGLLEKVEKINK